MSRFASCGVSVYSFGAFWYFALCAQSAVHILSACFLILQCAQSFPSVTSPRFGTNGLFVFLGFVMGSHFSGCERNE